MHAVALRGFEIQLESKDFFFEDLALFVQSSFVLQKVVDGERGKTYTQQEQDNGSPGCCTSNEEKKKEKYHRKNTESDTKNDFPDTFTRERVLEFICTRLGLSLFLYLFLKR